VPSALREGVARMFRLGDPNTRNNALSPPRTAAHHRPTTMPSFCRTPATPGAKRACAWIARDDIRLAEAVRCSYKFSMYFPVATRQPGSSRLDELTPSVTTVGKWSLTGTPTNNGFRKR
jgi:hypothetical protein